jgi:hypothetical protein
MSLYFSKIDLSQFTHRPARDAETKFPCKLYHMLDDVEKRGLTHIASWHPDGMCFRVHDPRAFVEQILPQYFKKSKFRSFQRQLNLYGFHRITALNPFWESCYHHPDFIKGDEAGCRKINRPLRRKSQTSSATKNINIDRNNNNMIRYGQSSILNKILIPSPQQQEVTAKAVSEERKDEDEDEEKVVQDRIFSSIEGKALTRRNSYQDLCETIMGPDCEVCKDGSKLIDHVISS